MIGMSLTSVIECLLLPEISSQMSYVPLYQQYHSVSIIKDVEYLDEREEQSHCEVGEPVDCPSYHECGRPLWLLEKLSSEDKGNPTWNGVQQDSRFREVPLPPAEMNEPHTSMTSTALQLSAGPSETDLSKSYFREVTLLSFMPSHLLFYILFRGGKQVTEQRIHMTASRVPCDGLFIKIRTMVSTKMLEILKIQIYSKIHFHLNSWKDGSKETNSYFYNCYPLYFSNKKDETFTSLWVCLSLMLI